MSDMREVREMQAHRQVSTFVALATLLIASGILCACSSAADDAQPAGFGPPSPSVSGPYAAPMPDGRMEAGTYAFEPLAPYDFNASHLITMDVPGGYSGDDPVIFKGPSQGVSVWGGRNVYADPCAWMGSQLNPPVGSSVRGLAAALVAQKGRQASTPTHVTLDGYSGMYVELTTPANLSDCDRGQYRSWLGRYTEPGQQDMLWIINVDGTPLIIDAALGPKLTQVDRAERIQIVESTQIESY